MIKGMIRLMTGGDVAKIVIALLLGAGAIALVVAGMTPGTGRVFAEIIIGALTVGAVVLSGRSVFNRYRKLSNGKCPYPLCHGVVQHSQLVGKGNVVCPTCKKTWPELDNIHFKPTARS